MCSNIGGGTQYNGGVRGSDGAELQNRNKRIDEIDTEIEAIRRENVRLLQSDYTGSKGWGKQLEARTKKAVANNRKIQKLEAEKRKLQKAKQQGKKKTSAKSSDEPKRDKYTGLYSIRINGKTIYYDSYGDAKDALSKSR